MIILNNKKFAENETEFTESLFNRSIGLPWAGGTCAGYAKRLKRRIKLYNIQKELIGTINKYGVLCCATKIDGSYWYSYADINIIGAWDSYLNQYETINSLAVTVNSNGYYFI